MWNQNRKRWIAALRVAFGAGALAVLYAFVDVGEIVAALQSATAWELAAALLLNLATRSAAAARSYSLSSAARLPLRYSQSLQALFIANFWGLAVPGVSAGGVSTVLRYRHHGAGVAQSIAVLAASRVVELTAFCLLALLGLTMSSGLAVGARPWATGALLGSALGCAGLILTLRYYLPWRVPLLTDGPGSDGHWPQKIRSALASPIELLQKLPAGALRLAGGWAVLQGLLDAATVLVLARALDIPIDMPHALWINALSYLAILLPISVVGLGMREAAVLAALLPLGIGRGDALALAFLMLAMTLFNALVGAVLQLTTRSAERQLA